MVCLPSNALLHLSPPTDLEKPQIISRTLAVHDQCFAIICFS